MPGCPVPIGTELWTLGGCIFCSSGGSGDFAVDIAGKTMEEQIAEGMAKFGDKVTVMT